jgi:hypothetical protein
MIGEGFIMSLANAMGIPIGAKFRRGNYTNNTKKTDLREVDDVNLDDSLVRDFINALIDIAKDDVVVGDEPMFFTAVKRGKKEDKLKRQLLADAFNNIAPWVAFDILKTGLSVYTYIVKDGKIFFIPYLRPVRVYLRTDYSTMVVDEENEEEIVNCIAFVNYDKESLIPVDETDDKIKDLDKEDMPPYLIKPAGIMTKNALTAIEDLGKCENDIKNLRSSTSRVVRFVSVEVGLNKGDQQQEYIDDISEGLNANSSDMVQSPTFDDQIPVFPTRKGLGKPEYEEHLPSADLSQLSDLDYWLSKLFLSMRFPKSYADFSQNLSQTAVSMIRGDIRYSKLLRRAQAVIERDYNTWTQGIPAIKMDGVWYELTQIPSSEDDDLVATLQANTDFAADAISYITEADTKEEAEARLNSLKELFDISTNAEGIERWMDSIRQVIESRYSAEGGTQPSEGDFTEEFPVEEEQPEETKE